MRIPRRFGIVIPWLKKLLKGERVNTPVREVVSYLCRPGKRQRGGRFIQSLEQEGQYWRILFCGVPDPLYLPVSFDLDSLYDFADEQFDATNWHQYEISETRVDPADIVLDGGSCEGLFALRVAHRCRKVFAFEPLPDLQAALQKTFEKLPTVEVIPLALGDSQNSIYFNASQTGGSHKMESGEFKVTQTTIDSFVRERGTRINYLKADIEGNEMAMLEGARETLIRDRPKIAITTYHCPGDSERFTRFLESLGVGYRTQTKGLNSHGEPVMLHAWAEPNSI